MKICIIGGGSAGWMTASYLATINPEVSISLIESSDIPIVGVGESTVPSFVDFVHAVGLTEDDLFKELGSIRKYTLEHNNWNGDGHQWYHHFIFNKDEELEQLTWLKNKELPNKKWRHSYHIDAGLFADLLKKQVGIPKNVNHIIDNIINVNINSDGITSIDGEKGKYTADLYIDCSGFKRLLIGKFNLPTESNLNLVNNKAWAAHADYKNPDKSDIAHFTRTIAMNAGWQWNICLQNRVGVGYVFCDQYITDEEAKQELIKNCPYTVREETLKLIKYNSQWLNEAWHKNVLAIGLSAGFLEPLESQSIFLIQMQITMLSRLISKKNNIAVYNKFWNIMIRHIANYIGYHYTLSRRNDTDYWKSFDTIDRVEYTETHSPLFHEYSHAMINEAYSKEY
jgi:tryptophan halogenase